MTFFSTAPEWLEQVLDLYDSFEDGDLAEYSGTTSDWTTSTTYATDGSVSLYQGGSASPIYRTDQTLTDGNTFKVDLYSDSAENEPRFSDPKFWFGVQDSSNYYNVSVEGMGSETYQLSKVEAGSGTALDSIESPTGGTQDVWTTIEIDWYSNGDINVSWNGYNLSANDSTFTSGGYGFYAGGSGAFYFDHVSRTQSL